MRLGHDVRVERTKIESDTAKGVRVKTAYFELNTVPWGGQMPTKSVWLRRLRRNEPRLLERVELASN